MTPIRPRRRRAAESFNCRKVKRRHFERYTFSAKFADIKLLVNKTVLETNVCFLYKLLTACSSIFTARCSRRRAGVVVHRATLVDVDAELGIAVHRASLAERARADTV